MLSDDLLNVISEYMDLGSYQLLISDNSKIFTLIKYKKLQREYDIYFYEHIQAEYYNFHSHFKKLNIKDPYKQKYFVLKHYYSILKKIIYALEYCNIFVYTDTIEKLDLVDLQTSTNNQLKKCKLTGYLISEIDGYQTKDKIVINYNKKSIPNSGGLYYDHVLEVGKADDTLKHILYINKVDIGILGIYFSCTKQTNEFLGKESYDSLPVIGSNIVTGFMNNGLIGALNGLLNTSANLTASIESNVDELDAEYLELLELIKLRNEKIQKVNIDVKNIFKSSIKFTDIGGY